MKTHKRRKEGIELLLASSLASTSNPLAWMDVPVDTPAIASSCTQLPPSKVLPERSKEMLRNTSFRNKGKGNFQEASCLHSHWLWWDEDSESSCRLRDHKAAQWCTPVSQRTNTKNCLYLWKVEAMQIHLYTPRWCLHTVGVTRRTLQYDRLCLPCRNKTKSSNAFF